MRSPHQKITRTWFNCCAAENALDFLAMRRGSDNNSFASTDHGSSNSSHRPFAIFVVPIRHLLFHFLGASYQRAPSRVCQHSPPCIVQMGSRSAPALSPHQLSTLARRESPGSPPSLPARSLTAGESICSRIEHLPPGGGKRTSAHFGSVQVRSRTEAARAPQQ